MKKMMSGLLAVVVAVCMMGCGSGGTEQVLNVYNAGEYIGENVLSNFEDEFNCKVNYSTFASNEEMYTKLMSEAEYDVLVPSDYMIQRLIKEDMLQPIDKSIVTNLDLLAEPVKNLDWDPDNTYAVPYFWGSVGIVYDKNNVSQEDLKSEQYAIFKDPKYAGHVFMYDSERDAFMIAFKDLGYSMNTSDEGEIQEAYQWLVEMNQAVHPSYVTDESIDGMVNGEKWLALMYSGDAAYIISENPDMGYYCPDYGTNIWIDAMVITKNAPHAELANEFINYMLTYEASLDNSETVGYASANAQVLEELSSEGGMFYNNEAYVPRSDNPNDEMFVDNEVLRKELSDLWVKVKLSE